MKSELTSHSVRHGNSSGKTVALVCSGLGNIERGFEVSTARWFSALKKHTDLNVHLISGGKYPESKVVPTLSRKSNWLKFVEYVPFLKEQQRCEMTYGIEQFTFFPGMLAELARLKPDAVWVKDVPLAHMILGAKYLMPFDYKVIFANGGALRPKSYWYFDRIQQLHPDGFKEALAYGIPEDRMDVITNCIDSGSFRAIEKRDIRSELNFAPNDYVVVCTAAWNRYHKRIDYLIEEVARVKDDSVKLLLCGMPEADAQQLQELGERLLGHRIRWLTVAPQEISSIVADADLFVLPSLNEGLGNALIEASLLGKPIISHPHGGAKFILEDDYWMRDLSQPGALAARIEEMHRERPPQDRLDSLVRRVSHRFSDSLLSAEFQEMIRRATKAKSAPGLL